MFMIASDPPRCMRRDLEKRCQESTGLDFENGGMKNYGYPIRKLNT